MSGDPNERTSRQVTRAMLDAYLAEKNVTGGIDWHAELSALEVGYGIVAYVTDLEDHNKVLIATIKKLIADGLDAHWKTTQDGMRMLDALRALGFKIEGDKP